MKAIVFDEANFDYKLAPKVDGSMMISDPPSFRGSQGEPGGNQIPCIVLCYEVTDKDLQRMRETNRLWLIITGTSLPPITLQSEHPFIINRGEETAGQEATEEKRALSKQAEIILRYEDVIKRCQRILGEQIDPLSKMEPEEAISQLLSILDNKDFCEFMGSSVTTIESGTICGPKEVVMQPGTKTLNPGSREKEEEIIRIPTKQFDPAWRETVKEIVILSVDQQRAIKEITEFIENSFEPIGEIQIIQDELDKNQKKLDGAVSLLRECITATLDTPQLQQRIIDFLKAK